MEFSGKVNNGKRQMNNCLDPGVSGKDFLSLHSCYSGCIGSWRKLLLCPVLFFLILIYFKSQEGWGHNHGDDYFSS